ncbi:MAG TPA: hypothetical protein VN911_07995, partial [Candidatus Acidoferrum sp.]|nr:hypothetical protein [Candidatus Acidoferrum sp.]
MQQNIVADFSMKNGRENRTNGNQEKGKEEKEALRKSVRVKRGTPKASPKFLYGRSGCDVFAVAEVSREISLPASECS